MVRQSEIDLIHIHTASDISWLRKKTFIRKSLKLGLPVIVSIHGGNFDKFCKRNFGIFGHGVRRLLSNPKITTVALTKRCRKLVSPWTGSSTEVIPNFISSTTNDSSVGARKAGRLLFIGRDSKEKRANLAVEIANNLQMKGYNSTLVLAGIERNSRSIGSSVNKDYISPRGWLDSRKISELIRYKNGS